MLSDNVLILNISNGDEHSFNQLFYRYYPTMVAVAGHLIGDNVTAKDIAQEVFARLWVGRRRYADIKSPKDFLFISTRNRALSHLRSKKSADTHHNQMMYEERFRAGVIEEESYRLLEEAIQKLPERTREVIQRSLEGLKQDQIAEEMGIAITTVKTLKADGIRKLRQLLDPKYLFLLLLL